MLLPAKVCDEVGKALACVGAVVALNHGEPTTRLVDQVLADECVFEAYGGGLRDAQRERRLIE